MAREKGDVDTDEDGIDCYTLEKICKINPEILLMDKKPPYRAKEGQHDRYLISIERLSASINLGPDDWLNLGRYQAKCAEIFSGFATLGTGEPDSRYVSAVQELFSELKPRTPEGYPMALSFDPSDPMCFCIEGKWYTYLNRKPLAKQPLGI